jgi:hypothetical protein
MRKEAFWGLPLCNGLNKTMPLIHPIGAVTAATLCMSMHTRDGEFTRVLPSQGTAQGVPEARVEERLFHGHQKRGVVIVSRPGGELPARSRLGGSHPVRTVNVIASCDGGVECLCDGHGSAPRTSGSTGTEMSGRDLNSKRPLHRLIDFTASELESYQKGCRKQQGWKPAKSRPFLQRFGRSQRISFLIDKSANALYPGQLVKPDSASLAPYR